MRMSDLLRLGKNAMLFAAGIVIVIGILWFVGYRVIYRKCLHGKKNIKVPQLIWAAAMIGYLFVVLYATLVRGGYYAGRSNLVPLSSYRQAWYQFNVTEWRNLILNICMFVPLGILLPMGIRFFRKAYRTYLAGFLMSVAIESVQLVAKRGVFETDDIINNTVGGIVGFGLFYLGAWIVDRFRRMKHYDLKKALLCQIPLVAAVAVFCTVFAVYDHQELGNLPCDDVTAHHIPEVTLADGVQLSDDAASPMIYKMKIYTKEETHALAQEFFAKYGLDIDETRNDLYNDTAVYYSEDGALDLWIDYCGGTYQLMDFDKSHPQDGSVCEYLKDADEATVRQYLENAGIAVPENAVFARLENDQYRFDLDGDVIEDQYLHGSLRCSFTQAGDIVQLDNQFIACDPYRETDVRSEQEAYETLCTGKFRSYDWQDTDKMEVTGVRASYSADSMGFYRPVYVFMVRTDATDGLEIAISCEK